MLKLNIASPITGKQKTVAIEDEQIIKGLYDMRLADEIEGSKLGTEYKGYIFKIMGGHDKQGFPMKQGVLTSQRVRLLLREDVSCYNRYDGQKRKGARRRKSVRGCIVSNQISILNLIVVKRGDQDIEGVTEADSVVPNRLGPKRASNIRKLFNLGPTDDVRKFVIRRSVPIKGGDKTRSKAPKIQRLITPRKLQHKRHKKSLQKRRSVKARTEAHAYAKMLAQRRSEQKSRRNTTISRRRSAKSAQ